MCRNQGRDLLSLNRLTGINIKVNIQLINYVILDNESSFATIMLKMFPADKTEHVTSFRPKTVSATDGFQFRRS